MFVQWIKLSVICAAIFSFAMNSHAADWELAKEDDGVTVYTKGIEGTEIRAFKAETVITAEIKDIAHLFNNASAYKDWLADISYSKLVKKSADNDQYVYLIQKTPFVIKDRDVVAHGIVIQNPDTKALTVSITAADGLVKENSKYVRIPLMDGNFIFTPIGDGKLRVVYELTADPGGSIPAALSNRFAVDMPFKTLYNLREISKDLSDYRDPNNEIMFENADNN